MFEGAVIGKQILLFSTLAMFSFETEADCEAASKILHEHEYVEGSCFKTYKYVHQGPMKRPDDLWRSVSGGRE